VPPPDLPRLLRAEGPQQIQRVFATVEQEAARAGCSPGFTRGISDALRGALSGWQAPDIYPSAMYYFIVREASVGRDRETTAQELVAAHRSGVLKALMRLAVQERR
jgi:hypothetical protein